MKDDPTPEASMATAAAVPASYLRLVRQLPLRVIRDDKAHAAALGLAGELMERESLDAGEEEYLDALTALIERYESETIADGEASGADVLRHLIDARGVSQREVARETGIAASTVSELLAGRRAFTAAHLVALARYFHVNASAFLNGTVK